MLLGFFLGGGTISCEVKVPSVNNSSTKTIRPFRSMNIQESSRLSEAISPPPAVKKKKNSLFFPNNAPTPPKNLAPGCRSEHRSAVRTRKPWQPKCIHWLPHSPATCGRLINSALLHYRGHKGEAVIWRCVFFNHLITDFLFIFSPHISHLHNKCSHGRLVFSALCALNVTRWCVNGRWFK